MSRLFGLALLAGLWICSPASAVTLEQLSLDQMAQSATAIVRAKVVSSSASFTGSTIYTHYKLATSETWKGFPASEVMIPGGIANGYRQSFPGVPELQTGAEYVLFLWTSSSGITHLVGLSQGIFSVSQVADGTLEVSRPKIGENMLSATGQKVVDQAIQMELADMKSRVSRTSAGGANRLQ